ncbi:MAG TPA: thiolase family protein, partial [Gemmatimonadales bacterium]|nr:thiolase family protein [Gemmatimonadales bacterium]
DGASVCVLMEAGLAAERGLEPLGRYLGMAVAGTEPDEMGIGPIFAVPKLLKRLGLRVVDIDLWELNEAFACQVVYCRDRLGIPMDRLNVNGGSIAIGHPFGATGARLVTTLANEMRRRDVQFGLISICAQGGMGYAMVLERV